MVSEENQAEQAVEAAPLPIAGIGGPSSDISVEETGTVKWFSVEKGYGFITRSGGSDVFEHISGLERSGLTRLSEGVEYSSMSPRAARGRKPEGAVVLKSGQPDQKRKAAAGVSKAVAARAASWVTEAFF
jgi:cold shock protein